MQSPDMQQEAKGIARFIKARIDARTVTPGNILVLAPRREFGYLVRDELQAVEISAHSFFSEELLDGDPKDGNLCEAQQALALLMLLADPEDRVALRCWCGFGTNSLLANPWAKLRHSCEETNQSPWEVLEQLESGSLRIANTSALVTRFTSLKSRLTELRALSGHSLVVAIFPADQEWAKPFAALASQIEGKEFGSQELVDVIRRNVTQPELPTDVDYVRVMSLHKSKGLTADMVVVVGCLEGLMPSIDSQASSAGAKAIS
jgi:DNA helicase-2/ATP-dependent DNA helicase PcrA